MVKKKERNEFFFFYKKYENLPSSFSLPLSLFNALASFEVPLKAKLQGRKVLSSIMRCLKPSNSRYSPIIHMGF